MLNRYTETNQGTAPAAAPEYDDDGSLLKYRDGVYQWNAENRPVSVQPQNPVSGDRKITFLYDYMGRRVRKQVFVHSGTAWNPAPETEKLFVYEGWNVVKESTVTVPKAGNRAAGRGTAAGVQNRCRKSGLPCT
ncbi:MAG: hypothetical protein AB7S75_13495 [Desulfococcaceae bacterium]